MNQPPSDSYAHLPGGEYVADLADLARQRETIPAFLLTIAAARLTAAGIPVPGSSWPDPESRLYRLLRDTHGDEAHSQYNAHVRRLDSLCRALERAGSSGRKSY